ncbi:nucleotidyl transferase AbiEii/AbiGii toxin family protein [Phytoactinopolyspora limicola]|uniref:nucleotidyl transferase AbiEii/AbiGii toxin family protein n=1 Tax=Phytoactinopolyspora limicola TaxID=2715536 RepID=UPI00140945B2|nr:nucleotidyl transferase AbiEii/AbiGii toxin family protein [Phytoactinopolyspora limicola]
MVFDRFLARLVEVAAGEWVLKGGLALDLRLADRARSTKDIDLAWRGDEDELLDVLIDAAVYDQGDFFTFAVERTGDPDRGAGGGEAARLQPYL